MSVDPQIEWYQPLLDFLGLEQLSVYAGPAWPGAGLAPRCPGATQQRPEPGHDSKDPKPPLLLSPGTSTRPHPGFLRGPATVPPSPALCDSASAATSARHRRTQNEWAGRWPARPPGCGVTGCCWWARPAFARVSRARGDVPETPRRGSTTWMSDRIRRWQNRLRSHSTGEAGLEKSRFLSYRRSAFHM